MRRIAIALFFVALCASGRVWATACPTGYAYTATITVKHNASLSADVTNWPELFTCGNTVCKSTGNTGQVTDAGAKDVVFCTASTGGTVLTYELVPNSYSATAGTAEWWIKLPIISKTTDQTIYAMIGKSSPTDFSCNLAGSASCGTTLFPGGLLRYHWGYDNGSTSALSTVDSIGNAPSPTNTGIIKLDNTTFPPVYEESGNNNTSTNHFDTGYAPNSAIIGNFSVEFWESSNDTATSQGLMGNRSSGPLNGFQVESISGSPCGTPFAIGGAIFTGATNYKGTCTTTSYGGGVWHHVVMTHVGGSAGLLTIYVDGAAQSTATYESSGSPVNPGASTGDWYYFATGTSLTGWGHGSLDETGLYNAVLTADQAKADYTFENNPTAQYTITATANSSASARHGSHLTF